MELAMNYEKVFSMRCRDPTKNGEPCPDYGPNTALYTFGFHYGGIVENWEGVYIGGDVLKFDHVNTSRYSLKELIKFIVHLEKCKEPLLWGRCHTEKYFTPITNDVELQLLLKHAEVIREVNLYSENTNEASKVGEDNGLHDVLIEEIHVETGSGRGSKKQREKKKMEEVKRGKRPVEVIDVEDVEEDDAECRDNDYKEVEDEEIDNDDQDFDKFTDKEAEWAGIQKAGGGSGVDEAGQLDPLGEDDVCLSEDDFRSIHESDDDNPDARAPGWRLDYRRSPTLVLGMVFSTKKEFRDMMDTHAIIEKRSVSFKKSDKHMIYAICDDSDCGFRLNALRRPGESSFVVTTCIPNHTCAPSFTVRNMNSRWLASRFGYVFQTDKKRKIRAFRDDASAETRVDITKWQAYLCKQRSVRGLEGRRTNPGSTVILNVDQTPQGNKFSRFYVCLAALKEGLLIGCRPVFGLDGTFLKGPHGGILLTAVGVDPNNNSFSFAYAVVSTENGDNWCWFVKQLKADLGIENTWQWTIISDKQKGLTKAVDEEFPGAAHRFCVRHMHLNMRNSGFRGNAFKVAVWRAAKACTTADFNRRMEELKNMDKAAFNWLNEKPPHQWSRSHFDTYPKCDLLMNNMCESFNSKILEARELPILSMLETIMNELMKRCTENRDRSKKWKGVICPRIQRILDFNNSNVADCMPIKASDTQFQIACFDGNQYAVDLEQMTCACRKWDLTGIPCKHALSAIHRLGKDHIAYVHRCYRVETYLAAYGPVIKPINGRQEWASVDAIPPLLPKLVRRAGRPPKARRREPDEPQDETGRYEAEREEMKKILQDCGLEDIDDEEVLEQIFKDNNNMENHDVGGSQEVPVSQLSQVNSEFNNMNVSGKNTGVPPKLQPKRKCGKKKIAAEYNVDPVISELPESADVSDHGEGAQPVEDTYLDGAFTEY